MIYIYKYDLRQRCEKRGLTYVANWLVHQPIANGRRRKMCEAGGHVVLAGAAGTLSPAP